MQIIASILKHLKTSYLQEGWEVWFGKMVEYTVPWYGFQYSCIYSAITLVLVPWL